MTTNQMRDLYDGLAILQGYSRGHSEVVATIHGLVTVVGDEAVPRKYSDKLLDLGWLVDKNLGVWYFPT